MSTDDDKLSALMRGWKPPEPGPHFEQQVMRRIREPGPSWHDLAEAFFFRPVLVQVAATLTAIAFGAWLGIASPAASTPSVGVLAAGSVSGNYTQLVTGGLR